MIVGQNDRVVLQIQLLQKLRWEDFAWAGLNGPRKPIIETMGQGIGKSNFTCNLEQYYYTEEAGFIVLLYFVLPEQEKGRESGGKEKALELNFMDRRRRQKVKITHFPDRLSVSALRIHSLSQSSVTPVRFSMIQVSSLLSMVLAPVLSVLGIL